jgi:DNA (cytosine-5)-methyltransferase 1
MKVAHLFAGIGGGLYADLILGHDPVVAVEIDAYCCQVLRERKADGTFPNLRVIHADVRGVDFTRELAGVDAICAGFPCQDISIAGKGVGITGERSGLFREILRAIDAVRPAWAFLENSPNIRTKGRHVVIGELVARGYSWRDGRLAASDVGAPHRRSRWWCLARRADSDGVRKLQPQGGEQDEWRRSGDMGQDVSNPSGVRLEESQPGEAGREQSAAAGSHRGASWWGIEPRMGRVAARFACRKYRIKALGNAQVPLQAAVAWRLLGGP